FLWRVTVFRSWIDRVIALRFQMDRVIVFRQISVIALFYLEDSRRIHPQSVRVCQPKDAKRREWRSPSTQGMVGERDRDRETERERQKETEREREKIVNKKSYTI
ncbi:hypothetical protein U6K01_12315, partial [Cutibacterium acnes]